jgi:hypothetical protein
MFRICRPAIRRAVPEVFRSIPTPQSMEIIIPKRDIMVGSIENCREMKTKGRRRRRRPWPPGIADRSPRPRPRPTGLEAQSPLPPSPLIDTALRDPFFLRDVFNFGIFRN